MVQARFQALQPEEWAISAMTYAEILTGLEPLPTQHPLRFKSSRFLFSATVLPWPAEAASAYASIRHRTHQQPLDALDALIASHAIAIDAVLVTNNIRHFGRVGAPLRFENWVSTS